MLDRVRVTVWLNRLFCVEGYEGLDSFFKPIPGPEPYLWPLFFAIDGRDVLIRPVDDNEGNGPNIVLGGRPSIQKSTGAPDNMGAHGRKMFSGQEARVPGGTGMFVRESPAMRLPFPCDPLRPDGVLGTVGLVVGLWDHDESPHHSIRAGYEAFAEEMQRQLTNVIDGTPIIGAGDLSQEELDTISERVRENVEKTVKASLSIGEMLSILLGFSGIDDQIGAAVFTYDLPGLVKDVARVERKTITKPLKHPSGAELGTHRWELDVIAIATHIAPDDAVMDVVGMHGLSVPEPGKRSKGRWVGPWAALMGDLHAPLLGTLVLDPARGGRGGDGRRCSGDPEPTRHHRHPGHGRQSRGAPGRHLRPG